MTGYRELPPAAVLPLPGGRVYELGRAGSAPLAWMMLAWVGGGIGAGLLGSVLSMVLPPEVVGVITFALVIGALIGSNLVYRRLTTRSRWRLHLSPSDAVLERTGSAPAAFDLAHITLTPTRHAYAARGMGAAMPTVRVDLPERALVITGPLGDGWMDLDREEPGTAGDPAGAAPDVRLANAAAFAALRKRAQQ